jgi:hypothetical protein
LINNALSEDLNKDITGDDDSNEVIDHNDKTSPGEMAKLDRLERDKEEKVTDYCFTRSKHWLMLCLLKMTLISLAHPRTVFIFWFIC